MNISNNSIRFHVYDLSDRLCGVWYARDEIAAIQAARAERYDAWSARAVSNWGY